MSIIQMVLYGAQVSETDNDMYSDVNVKEPNVPVIVDRKVPDSKRRRDCCVEMEMPSVKKTNTNTCK
jgi:hypothetical protein